MAKFRDFNRNQAFLLPPSLNDWVPEDDLAHFVIEAVDRVSLDAFKVNNRRVGQPRYHPRMLLGLLIYGYANGFFSSRRLERATYRDLGVRFVAANTHPDHDTIATFRRENRKAFEAAFLEVLLMAKESGLLKLGTVSIDGTKIDANASKIRSVRYDRALALREKLSTDIADLTAQAEAADAEDAPDPQALPKEIARRETLKAKLDEACKRLEAEAEADHEEAKRAYEAKKADYDAKSGPKGSPPKPPGEGSGAHGPAPRPERQTNLTDPDSQLMRKSARHEYRQAYNAQAVVDADGTQLVVATNVATTPSDQPVFVETIAAIDPRLGVPKTVLGDAGYASREAIEALKAKGIDPLVAIAATQPHRPYDFRPPPDRDKPERAIKEPWKIEMKEKLKTREGRKMYKLRKQTVEPVFGIIKSVLGFRTFRLRGLEKVKSEWALVALAYNCKRMAKLGTA